MNIAATVEEGRRLHPERPALVFEGEAISYRRLDELASFEAARLRAAGIERGDRVALCLPNTPQFVASYLGALKLGAIAVSVNPALTGGEIRFILDDSGAAEVIRNPDRWRRDRGARNGTIGSGRDRLHLRHHGLSKRRDPLAP